MHRKKILVLGAGLAGLSAGWHLRKCGADSRVFEKEPEVGGLCRSKHIGGFIFDYDGHLLHFKHADTFNTIKNLFSDNLVEHKRSSWVYLNGSYSPYPFQANLHGLPSSIAEECLLGFIQANKNNGFKKKEDASFLEWIQATFGDGIAKHFMIPYNTKFWTMHPEQLTCGWLDGFIPVPSLSQVIAGVIEGNQTQFGYNMRFWYPKKGGINQLALALASQIKNINVNCEISRIDLKKKEIETTFGQKEPFDYLISTVPLPEISRIIEGVPGRIQHLFRKLKWNSIFNINLGVDKKDLSGKHWAYFPEDKLSFFRVGFPHNFSSDVSPANNSSLYVEVAYSKDKPIDKTKIILRCVQDLKKVGIIAENDKIVTHDINDIKYGYPIYDRNYLPARNEILKYLLKSNIIPCGRYGSWRYMSMEDSFLDGKYAADYVKHLSYS